MNKIFKILSEEHKVILEEIEKLENECSRLSDGGEIDAKFIEDAVRFIREYADKFHHAKEEDILFAKIKEENTGLSEGPVAQMLVEHDMGREFVAGMEKGVEDGNREEIIGNALGYAQLLKNHIYKEDNILYPMADEVLSEEGKKEILKKFEEVKSKQ